MIKSIKDLPININSGNSIQTPSFYLLLTLGLTQ